MRSNSTSRLTDGQLRSVVGRTALVLALVLLSGIIHELGHVLALAYFGIPSRIEWHGWMLVTTPAFGQLTGTQVVAFYENILWICVSGGLFAFVVLSPLLRYRYLAWIPLSHLLYSAFEPAMILLRPYPCVGEFYLYASVASCMFSVLSVILTPGWRDVMSNE